MYLQAGQGLWLTQAEDVKPSERIFRNDRFFVATTQQAAEWVEITGDEKASLEREAQFFDLDNLSYERVRQIDQVNKELRYKINDAQLSNTEALEMKQYYPTWQQCWGRAVQPGFKFLYNGVLMEVVTAHTMSEDIKPDAKPNDTEIAPQPQAQLQPNQAKKPMQMSSPSLQKNPVVLNTVKPDVTPCYYKEVIEEPKEEPNTEGESNAAPEPIVDPSEQQEKKDNKPLNK